MNTPSHWQKKVLQNAYNVREHLDGTAILQLTPIKQVNYFVLKHLYRTWQKEMIHLKSPFFAYEKVEVKDALMAFMNVLSKHIHIGKAAMLPLLQGAINETLLLLLYPQIIF